MTLHPIKYSLLYNTLLNLSKHTPLCINLFLNTYHSITSPFTTTYLNTRHSTSIKTHHYNHYPCLNTTYSYKLLLLANNKEFSLTCFPLTWRVNLAGGLDSGDIQVRSTQSLIWYLDRIPIMWGPPSGSAAGPFLGEKEGELRKITFRGNWKGD